LNALIGIISTPVSAPVIAATRLRKGSTNSTRGAARLVADTLTVARRCGARGLVVVRADSAFFNAEVVAAIRRRGARFSITARHDTAVVAAISSIPEQAWTPIRYPEAVWDETEKRWVSDAEVAETGYTAFTSRRLDRQVTARLIVRRVRRLNTTPGQDELVPGYRYHPVFTNTPLPMVQAEHCHRGHCHRGHAIVEQVIADLKQGPLAHLPSGLFTANGAWLVCAAMAFNLTRAAGCLASAFHAKATTGTVRAQLITVPARIATSARRIVLHLPVDWPWEYAWEAVFTPASGPPPTAT